MRTTLEKKIGNERGAGCIVHLYVAVYVIDENCVVLSWLIVAELADVGSRLLASKPNYLEIL